MNHYFELFALVNKVMWHQLGDVSVFYNTIHTNEESESMVGICGFALSRIESQHDE